MLLQQCHALSVTVSDTMDLPAADIMQTDNRWRSAAIVVAHSFQAAADSCLKTQFKILSLK